MQPSNLSNPKCIHHSDHGHWPTKGLETMEVKNDIELVEACLKGNSLAYKSLYEKYKVAMYTLCLRYMKKKEDAEDMLQEGWVTTFRELNRYDSTKGAFYTWIRRIFVNTNLQELRKKRLFTSDLSDPTIMLPQDEQIVSDLTTEEMVNMLQELPDGYRTVFNLYAIEGYTHAEIAEQLGVSVSTSKTQYMKARVQLQSMVKLAYAI